MALFSLPFVGGEMFGLWRFASATSSQAALIFTAVIAVNVVFVQLMKAPTLHGRRMVGSLLLMPALCIIRMERYRKNSNAGKEVIGGIDV